MHSPIEVTVGDDTFSFPATFDELPDDVFGEFLLEGDRQPLRGIHAEKADQYLASDGLSHGQMLALIRFLHAVVDDPVRWNRVTTTDGPHKPGIRGLAKIGSDLIATWRERDPLP